MRRNYCIMLILLCAVYMENIYAGEGVPFFRNYLSTEYGAHNRNFDVVCGKNGLTYFANFEGLLYYDNSAWRIVYTPGYSRITCLFVDSQGCIWAAGYNFVAKVTTDKLCRTVLHPVVADTDMLKVGEVVELFEEKGKIYFRTQEGDCYQIMDRTVRRVSDAEAESLKEKSYVVIRVPGLGDVEINQSVRLRCGWQVLASRSDGLIVLDDKGHQLYALTEANGLCSNSINRIAEGSNGTLWGVTDNGIFCVSMPSMFSRYSSAEGLKGEVTTMQRYEDNLYIGTLQGLYRAEAGTVRRIPEIRQACWQLVASTDGKLYAATSEGVFEINGKTMRPLTHNYTQALAEDADRNLYLAETDCIAKLSRRNGKMSYTRIADIEKVMKLEYNRLSGVSARDLSGNLYQKSEDSNTFLSVRTHEQERSSSAIDTHTPAKQERLNKCLTALHGKTIRSVYSESDSLIWVGGDFGVIRICLTATDDSFRHLPQAFIREVRIGKDSLYYGGTHVDKFDSRTKEVRFRFSSDALSTLGKVKYQYCLEGYDDGWSSWSDVAEKTFTNLFYGSYTFKVKARDIYGQCSEEQSYHFTILSPFYLKWYSLLLYLFLLAFIVLLCIKWRLRKLVKEKERLEGIVAARTMQISEQKEEIEKKSDNLEKALCDLRRAQSDLVRQEKMATVGKLTKGLIDRILNPLNYINNFSHLSAGLADEMRKNLCASKEAMDEADFNDSMDLLDMLISNLEKIGQHGGNTARVLKAMEEILKDRNRVRSHIDLASLCRKSLEMLRTYYKEDIERMEVSIKASLPETVVPILGNEEQLGKTLMSLLNNSMYAITRKYGKQAYAAEISLSLEMDGSMATVRLRDNGTGIEASIQEQVFDPFFTTKTSGEAAGVGLYLSREIIAAHEGSIAVSSHQGDYTEFIIKLPIIKN